jgi:hypothetical protein
MSTACPVRGERATPVTVQIRLDRARSFFEAEVDGKHAGHMEFVRCDGISVTDK